MRVPANLNQEITRAVCRLFEKIWPRIEIRALTASNVKVDRGYRNRDFTLPKLDSTVATGHAVRPSSKAASLKLP